MSLIKECLPFLYMTHCHKIKDSNRSLAERDCIRFNTAKEMSLDYRITLGKALPSSEGLTLLGTAAFGHY